MTPLPKEDDRTSAVVVLTELGPVRALHDKAPSAPVITFVWSCVTTKSLTDPFFSLMISPQRLDQKIRIHCHNELFHS
jgi:hypothetical protein